MAHISMCFKPMSATNVSFMNTDNNQTLTDRTQYGDITAEQYIEGILLTFICLVSVLGNISIWIIVLRSRALRTITNCFLLVLSAFDLLVSLINIPVTVLTVFSGEWFLSDDACIVFGFTNMVTLCGSVLSLCNISINRYVMVCHPSKFIEVYKRKNVAIMIIASIAVTIGVSVPPLLGWCEYSYTPTQYICFANWPMSLSYSFFMICCCFGVPLVVMIFCNYKIYRTVKISKNKIMDNYTVQMSISKDESESTLSDNTGQQGIRQERNQRTGIGNQDLNIETQFEANKSNRKILSTSFQFKTTPPKLPVVSKVSKTKPEEIRLAIMLGTIVIVFFICWFPYCISMILSIFVAGKVHRIFHMSTLLIGYFNSCCNPIIYGLLNKRFSDGFKKLYCFCRKRRILNL